MGPSVKTWVGWEVHLTERIETRQFIFIFDEVKLQLKKKKRKETTPNPVVTQSLFHRLNTQKRRWL